ncbi:MAG: RdgB/HAM1 family non-canonical purine NTP pyrophosphatase [Deltaproteobacteria bacterium]|nr:RdgB/HAM1 family non-canonical purine NTP pyrophosphatase [Deltaproteobacteria bacterium]
MRLLIATRNDGKVRELRRLLAGLPLEPVGPAEAGLTLDVEETGTTFEANAEAKARGFAEASGLPALADDSGLVVDALDGRPGVHSARFAGPPRSDARNLARLLEELRDVPAERRQARFVCVVALALPATGPAWAGLSGGEVRLFRGTCEGRIGFVPRGTDGFGYDPVFLPVGHERTFAELPADVKDGLSHRGAALRTLVRELVRVLGTVPAGP